MKVSDTLFFVNNSFWNLDIHLLLFAVSNQWLIFVLLLICARVTCSYHSRLHWQAALSLLSDFQYTLIMSS